MTAHACMRNNLPEQSPACAKRLGVRVRSTALALPLRFPRKESVITSKEIAVASLLRTLTMV
jgi:hypothetical protein